MALEIPYLCSNPGSVVFTTTSMSSTGSVMSPATTKIQ